jgi:hypothetical protein
MPKLSTISIASPQSDSTVSQQFMSNGSFVNDTGTASPGVYCTLKIGTTVLDQGWAFVNLENSTWTRGMMASQTGSGAVLTADLYPGDPPAKQLRADPVASASVTGLTITT